MCYSSLVQALLLCISIRVCVCYIYICIRNAATSTTPNETTRRASV